MSPLFSNSNLWRASNSRGLCDPIVNVFLCQLSSCSHLFQCVTVSLLQAQSEYAGVLTTKTCEKIVSYASLGGGKFACLQIVIPNKVRIGIYSSSLHKLAVLLRVSHKRPPLGCDGIFLVLMLIKCLFFLNCHFVMTRFEIPWKSHATLNAQW